MIRVENIYKQFGDVTAVNGVSFKAENGQVTGLLGPNGAGKSTTLRMLYGLVEPDAGAASVDGVYVNDDSIAVQQRIGVLPDTHGLYTRLTAREHIHYFGQLHELDRKTLLETTDHLIELLDMGSIAERRAEGFSQGERMKVCLARALVHQPPNVLLDEPTAQVDQESSEKIRKLIQMQLDAGKTLVVSTHQPEWAKPLKPRLCMLEYGRIVSDTRWN